ncbi:tyrosine-type recombinase/integrase [Liquorilactobacillus mali]|uniref:Phage integrase n=1 Tax=Liquorilactobacillus mali KCTC 3596 = DSM 20444 TaxID=1046596 RepID=J0UUZ7_9LACO|nr:site-specific integrase [Liquorilactobacillus mali]EJF02128.1 Phage integrase [Liquorilactobacillus mali KCTC 3596 = DSM 20444]KRN10271.1 phage integrase [Liquorilactobacillus mali KCTC 3596 = DSM 20444]MDV7758223.1 tyrosine-type recombinase/integrase [Liquorilactobacillus mali]QFQ74539.1 site-specific integrase [Liquorilactobacillus mali]
MAYVRQHGDKWQVRMTWIDVDNKRHTKNKSFSSKREAISYGNKLEVLKQNGFASVDSSSYFPDYFWEWFQTYKESSVTERTKKTYEQTYNALKKYFSRTAIEKIDRRKYQLFITQYGSKHAKSTVSKYNSLIHACVKDAIYDGTIQRDFVQNVNLVFDKSKKRSIDYLSIAETKKLSQYLKSTLNHNFTSKFMILLAMYSGARLGEIQALTWKDINMNFKTVSINKSWNETTKKFKETKNESSVRTIRLSKSILVCLAQLKVNQSKQVFENQYHTIPTSSAANKTLRQSLKECGINKPSFHFHSLRHTHVAFLLAKNIDLYIIAKRLGHSDISTTSRVYSYLIDEYKTRSDNQIENVISELFDEPSEINSSKNSLA